MSSHDPAADPGQPRAGANGSDAAAGEHQFPPLDLLSPQFTPRALLTGMLLGAVLSACNVYAGLRIGWGFNMSITAALLSYGFWMSLHKLAGTRRWGILENNINQTACSSGASVSSAGLVAPIPALAMLTGQTLSWHYLALWCFSVMLVGITVAIAVRRQMLLRDKLPFAYGIASAETLKEMYARGAEATARILMLVGWALAGSVTVVADFVLKTLYSFQLGQRLAAPGLAGGYSLKSLTFGLDPTLIFYGVGGLIGFRACASLLVGAILAYGVIAPPLLEAGRMRLTSRQALETLPPGVALDVSPAAKLKYDSGRARLEWRGVMSRAERADVLALSDDAGFQQAIRALYVSSQVATIKLADDPAALAEAAREFDDTVDAARVAPPAPSFVEMTSWLLWPGVTLMVVSSLVAFSFSWRSIAATALAFRRRSEASPAPKTDEVPGRWFVTALLVAFVLSVALQVSFFAIVLWAAALGVLLSFAIALVAARVAGETSITPVGAMGKVTQLIFGVLQPGQATPNLMTANVTGGAASQCADLLHDLKCGLMLGASPRLQSYAQIFGAFAGALAGSAVYLILIRDPANQLLTPDYPAPAVVAWKAVAELFMVGLEALPEGVVNAMVFAAIVGTALPVLEKTLPKPLAAFVPSAASLGLAFVVPASYSLTMFAGGLIALILSRVAKAWSTRFLVASCAGIIAGDSLTGVGLALYRIFAGV